MRDCIIKTNDLIDYAIELGHEVVAVTDHENICNAVKAEKYYNKVKKDNPNFKLIRGNEIYLCRNGLSNENFISKVDKYYHFVLLAKDAVGHQQIRELSTRAWKRSYMARGQRRVPTYYQDLFDIVATNKGHIIGSTACLGGALPTQLLNYKATKDENLMKKIHLWIQQMDDIFGHGNFYFELQPSESKEQTYVNRQLIELSKQFDIPYIITTDSHYLKKEDANIHKAFLNSQDGDREVDSFYATTYMMNTEELESYMDLTEEELQTAYQNILKIKEACEDYSLIKPLKIPNLLWKEPTNAPAPYKWFEQIPYLKTFMSSEFIGDHVLCDHIVKAINENEKLQNKETYDEINECLRMTWVSSEVNKTHWSAYYLNLQQIVEECWKAGTLVGPGRGSGVGFILLYLLDITQINPLWETTKTYPWRFLNPDRVSVLDVDVDIEGGRRDQVLEHLRKVYGEDRVANVATFGTEKSKSAIQTACRGLGIDVDIAQYLSSMITSDRGLPRTLQQTFYGDKENGFLPNKQFVYEMTENYPEVWEVAQKIEGLINRIGVHAGGVIFVDEPFTNSTALMRSPDGTICTQFELHDCEDVSLIKYDLLSVEALDKIHNCIDLLCDYDYAVRQPTLKTTYEKIIGIYNLEREAQDMWKMIWNHEILSLFQMEKQSGIQGIALTKPKSVDDLAVLNSVIRLMAQEKGAEQPLNKFARFKEDISLWYDEMEKYGLTKEEQEILEPIIKSSYGIMESQEKFMKVVQIPECGGFNLTWADKLRKAIAKKNPAEYEKLEVEYFKTVKEKGLSQNLCNYVWNVLVATSRGYGFNASHTLAYSLIGLQEMNLGYTYPTIFWNCACLIADSGGAENEENNEDSDIIEIDNYEIYDDSVETFVEESEDDEEDDEDSEEEGTTAAKKKKKTKSTNYGKIATAIGKMKSAGVNVIPPNINKSTFTFSPDVENNSIRSGLSGITKVGKELIQSIIQNRPYSSLEEFLSKNKITKPQMVNLIKCGAFDDFKDTRYEVMNSYIRSVSDQKKRITLQNMKMLIDFNLLPAELDFEKRIYNFNKYLKKHKFEKYYLVDEIAFQFVENNLDVNDLVILQDTETQYAIEQTKWDKIYNKYMDKVRAYIKPHHDELLEKLNNKLIEEMWNKYCLGSISKWEMDSISYYAHDHELSKLDYEGYGLVNFFDLPEQPEIDTVIPIKGKQVPLFKIQRIAGTVLDKDKAKKTVTLLTREGVVTVRIFGDAFTHYDRQISEKNPATGKKKVIERSWFSRGNKIIVTGIRREDTFTAKKYARTPFHLVERITNINDDGTITTIGERVAVE